jgi:hypothetical protein
MTYGSKYDYLVGKLSMAFSYFSIIYSLFYTQI